ncbi:MAG: hypothetical protein ACD_68C00043G0007 [uncultured bacterium]|nr:MAG: hypothetical protein ACD_68C00043G0007 [uncultured bacterium]
MNILEGLKLIKSLSWQEVFNFWRENEANEEHWKKHYQERGFSTWDEWRQTNVGPFKCAEKEWGLYEIEKPLEKIPTFFGGPFQGWMKNSYGGKNEKLFVELVELPDIQSHAGVLSISNNFPIDKTITGMIIQENKIVIIEGMHRCCAIALMARNKTPFSGTLKIALAKSDTELPRVGEGYSYPKRNSNQK